MEIGQILAQNLRRLRQERNLSLGQLAEASGVSKVMLSQIERGDSNPTINTLWKIANGLKVSYSALMDQTVTEVSVVHGADAPTQLDEDGRYRISCYFPSVPERDFELFGGVVEAGCEHVTEGHGPLSEEFVYVAEGTLEMTVGDQVNVLTPGDAIHFDASLPHRYRNPGETACKLVYVNRYPKG